MKKLFNKLFGKKETKAPETTKVEAPIVETPVIPVTTCKCNCGKEGCKCDSNCSCKDCGCECGKECSCKKKANVTMPVSKKNPQKNNVQNKKKKKK